MFLNEFEKYIIINNMQLVGVNSVIKWGFSKHLCMATRWSLERVWESTYDLRNEATVLLQVKEQQNPPQLYSAARPTGGQKKKPITWLTYPPPIDLHQRNPNQITMCSSCHTPRHVALSQCSSPACTN